MNQIQVVAPLTKEAASKLHCGDSVLISGVVYTARDAAHKRLAELSAQGKPLPFVIKNAVIYYVGPTPAQEGQVIGSAGPTTSGRMDAYAPTLLELGQTGMIGKGERGSAVVASMQKNCAVYFGAIGGAGALLASCIKKTDVVAYEDLGAEAIRRLEVENLPAVVVIDCAGNNLYEQGRAAYLASRT